MSGSLFSSLRLCRRYLTAFWAHKTGWPAKMFKIRITGLLIWKKVMKFFQISRIILAADRIIKDTHCHSGKTIAQVELIEYPLFP